MPTPVHLAFLGCGFITRVHSRHLRAFRGDVIWSYASRDAKKAVDFCGRYGGAEQLRRLPRGDRRSSRRRRGHRRPATLSPRPDAGGARRRQARAGREAGLSADGRLSRRPRRAQPRRPRRPGRGKRSLQAAGPHAPPAAGARRDRRDGVRAVRDHRQKAEDGRRLAQRRDDGRRRCVFRGRHSLAAPGRQPRAGDLVGAGLPAVASRAKARTAASRA